MSRSPQPALVAPPSDAASAAGRRHPHPRRIDALGALAAAVALAALVVAWRMRFVQDDAFIAFQYARGLVEGHGLTWFGNRVEGYTDFLWVLWIALGMRLGIDPIPWSYAGGLLAFGLVLHAAWRLGMALCGRTWAALAALLLLVTNASVLWFATGGLETMLQTACLARATLQFMHLLAAIAGRQAGRAAPLRAAERHAAALGAWLAAAVLTRPDSALPGFVLVVSCGLVLRSAWTGGARGTGAEDAAASSLGRGAPLRVLRALALPPLIVIVPWLGWKWLYYGQILPNTYAAKVGWSWGNVGAGFHYLGRFLAAYLWWPFLAVVGVERLVRLLPGGEGPRPWGGRGANDTARLADPMLPASVRRALFRTLLAVVTTWLAYVVAVGGDFMEFRFLVPVFPLVCVALVAGIATGSPPRLVLPALAVLVLVLGVASLQHVRRFRSVTPDRQLDSVPALATFYGLYPDGNFAGLGTQLGEELAGTDALLALHAVGAVPYYSRLRTLDMLGLNDLEVARDGLRAPPSYRRPGHQRQASIATMRARGVNLVVGHPTLVPHGTLSGPVTAYYGDWVRGMTSYSREPLGTVLLVGMPTPRGDLLAWYLTPTPAIDAAMRAHGWESARIEVAR